MDQRHWRPGLIPILSFQLRILRQRVGSDVYDDVLCVKPGVELLKVPYATADIIHADESELGESFHPKSLPSFIQVMGAPLERNRRREDDHVAQAGQILDK